MGFLRCNVIVISLNHNVLAFARFHESRPSERPTKSVAVLHPRPVLLFLGPEFFQDFETSEVIEVPAASHDLPALGAYDALLKLVYALAAGDEEWPEKELLTSRSLLERRDVKQDLRDEILEVEMRGWESRTGETFSV